MAIFERRFDQRIRLDDTHQIYCIIETAQEVNGHTEYLLRVQRGPNKDNCWKILRRYNDFAELHKSLTIAGIDLPMPGKRFIGNMRPDFIAERRQALQVYINAVLMNPILASSLPAKRFVDPDNYQQSFFDQSVQNVLLCLRGEGIWTLGATMGAIGWRLRKQYFKVTTKLPDKSGNKQLVKSGSQSHQSKHFGASSSNGGSGSSSGGGSLDSGMLEPTEMVLEWLEYGPDKYIDDKELGGILKSLMGMQHPHIDPIVNAVHNEYGCLVIRKFYKHGSLKDILCNVTTPKNPFLSKYGCPKGRTALSLKQVATFGYQILDTLIYLHAKGYPHGHLHSGNIVIVDDCVKLLDIENYILGVPAFYRPFFMQHSKIHTIETVDVYCFGHILFEMAMGYPLQESVTRQINECPEVLKHLLESILSKDACRAGLPTLDQLISHQFFRQHATVSSDNIKPHFKLSLNAKELLKQATQRCENRLRDEQKSVKNQKRIVRVQELMSSEEEKRKTKQKAKLEHKQSKLKQQSSLQASNGRLSLSSASGSATVISGVPPFNRSDSILSVHLSQEAAGLGAQLHCAKSTPATPSSTYYQYHQHDLDHHHQQLQQEHQLQQQQLQQQLQQQQLQTQQQQWPHSTATLASVERQLSSPNISSDDQSEPGRSALLESICKFNRGSLRKVRSND